MLNNTLLMFRTAVGPEIIGWVEEEWYVAVPASWTVCVSCMTM